MLFRSPWTRVATTRPHLPTPLQAYTTVSPLVPSTLSIPGLTTMPLLPVTILTGPTVTPFPIPRTTGQGPPLDLQGLSIPASGFDQSLHSLVLPDTKAQPSSKDQNPSLPSNPNKTYTFVSLPGTTIRKRPRRGYDEIEHDEM